MTLANFSRGGICLVRPPDLTLVFHGRMVQNSEWGPHLWQILHICAEKCGKQPTQMLHMDEIRAWIHVLRLVEAILPCLLCKKHYHTWLKNNPLQGFLEIKSPLAFYEAARNWVWKLHNTVNEQRGIEAIPFDEAMDLYATKGTKDLHQSLEKLMEVLDQAKLQRTIDGAFVREWTHRLGLFRRFTRV